VTRFKDDEEDALPALVRASMSEYVATLVFVLVGTGAVIASKAALGDDRIEVSSITLIALAHGFAITVLIYAIGGISGGHINPAVTWACLITDRISILRAIIYVFSQLLGAVSGSAILYSMVPESMRFELGCHFISPALGVGAGLWSEVVFTFIFILVVFSTAISPFVGKIAPMVEGDYGPGKLTPFAVGMCILILHAVGVPRTGASMNPARSFGPAVIRGCWDNHWVYWIGPLFGSTLAAIVAQLIFLNSPQSIAKILVYTRGVQQSINRPFRS